MTMNTLTPPAAAMHAPATLHRRERWLMGGLVLLLALGLYGLIASTGWDEISAQLSRITAVQIALLLGLSLVNYGFRALRWHLFARRFGLALSLKHNALHFLGGFAMSVTPGRVGELVRMRWIARETGVGFVQTAPLALMDRASDLAAMGLLLGLALPLSGVGIGGGVPVTLLALGTAIMVTRPTLLAALALWGHRLTGAAPRLFAKCRRAARALTRCAAPSTMIAATLLGLLGWCAEGAAFHLLLVWMGSDIGVARAMAIFIFATLAGGLTGAPGGLGGAEAAMIALLTLEGVPLPAAIGATAIIRLTTLWFAIAIGLAAFPLAERQSRKGSHALERC